MATLAPDLDEFPTQSITTKDEDDAPCKTLSSPEQVGPQDTRYWPWSRQTGVNVRFLDARASLIRFIAFWMRQVAAVEAIHLRYERTSNVFYAWIVIPERNEEVLDDIYARQERIIDSFPDFDFDFYVLYRNGADLVKMVSGQMDFVYHRADLASDDAGEE